MPDSRTLRTWLRSAFGFVGVVAVAAVAHHAALFEREPQQDEPVFVGAAQKMAAGASPYDQARYIYPPPLAAAGAVAIETGGTELFLVLLRAANLLSVAGLALFAASETALAPFGRWAFASALASLPPFVGYAIWIGNPTALAAALALAGWQLGRRHPISGAALVGVSLAVKPLALAGAIYLSVRGLADRKLPLRRRLGAIGWIPATALCLAPWAAELPRLLTAMSEAPILSARNLSLRRVFDGFGIDLPAAAGLGAVLGLALWMSRRRPVDDLDRRHTAPVVSLLALPVAWAHGFVFVLPLQVAAARRWWERRASRKHRNWRDLVERWSVPLALALICASVSAGVEFEGPSAMRSIVVLLPILSPLVLLLYLRLAPGGEDSRVLLSPPEGERGID